MKINEWLNSGEFSSEIDELRTSILRQSSLSKNEATTASIFEKELYFLIRQRTGIELNIVKEKTVRGIQHTFGTLASRISGRGHLDAVVNNLIIEYKHFSKLKSRKAFETAAQQVVDYLTAIYEETNIQYNAILTDGIKICYFAYRDNTIGHTALLSISNRDIDRIVRALLADNTKRFVPENILKDFSIIPSCPSLSQNLASALYASLRNNRTEKTAMLFEEWRNLMHLSFDDNGKGNDIQKRRTDLERIFSDTINDNESEYTALYALQTTYAIIVKLIACKVIDKLEYNDAARDYHDLSQTSSAELQKFFEKMEDGYSYKNNNITNFLEGDFFSWYSDAIQWNAQIYDTVLQIIRCLDQYSAFSMNIYYEPIDIFKDLYMSIIPKSIRHSMGEYFTPEWIADYIVSQSLEDIGNKANWKAIDPCCGSGIFLISLIKKIVGKRDISSMSRSEKENLRENILSRVYGVDINPLSVLSARVGYYLALQPLGDFKDIEIPVYLGDSALLAQKVFIDRIPCYRYTVANNKRPFEVILPERYVKMTDFGNLMSELQACVKTDSPEILTDFILDGFTDEEKNSSTLVSSIRELSEALTYLNINKWDGIWVRIATNFMMIARLSNFDLIVGNPPWVKWEHLPAAYANKIKEFCDVKHIFSTNGQFGGTQLNICALISNVTATNWLNPHGELTFLMPDSLMSQNSYEQFRNFWINYEKGERLYLQHVDRWLSPLRPFCSDGKSVSQNFNTYYFSRKPQNYSEGICVKNITREKNCVDAVLNHMKLEQVLPHLIVTNGTARQLSEKTTAFSYISSEYDFKEIIGKTYYTYRTGVEFTPQELFMLVGAGDSTHKDHYRFYNKKFQLSKYTIDDMPKDGWDLCIKNIYPIITGPHLSAFRFDSENEFCILPYDAKNTKQPISSKQMLKENKNVFVYLANHKSLIEKQSEKSKQLHRGDEFYSLSKIGPYTFADHIVAARDNSHFCAAVITKQRTPWGEQKNTICVKHTILIGQDIQGNFISEDEAFFLCGILNSGIVKKYIESSFKSNGYSLNKANIYIPKFEQKNALHQEIAKIAKEATAHLPQDIKMVQAKLTTIYLQICKEKEQGI